MSVKSKYISVSLGEQLDIDCFIEAFPKPTNYWSRKPAPRSDLSSSQNNDGFVIKNSNDNNISNERADQHPRAPKRKQMAIYEQVTTQQPQITDNGFITVLPDSKMMMAGTSLSDNSDKLVGGNSLGHEFVTSVASNRNLRQQYNSDKDTHKDKTQHRKQHIDYPSNEIVRHDFQRRLKLKRQVVMPLIESNLEPGRGIIPSPSDIDNSMSLDHSSSSKSPVDNNLTSAYVTVKQTATNSYTYKLRLTIDRVQAEDFGGYICISSNPLGTSQEYTFVTSK